MMRSPIFISAAAAMLGSGLRQNVGASESVPPLKPLPLALFEESSPMTRRQWMGLDKRVKPFGGTKEMERRRRQMERTAAKA